MHHVAYSELERSATEGCYVCVRVFKNIDDTIKSADEHVEWGELRYNIRRAHDRREFALSFRIVMANQEVETDFVLLEYLQYTDQKFNRNVAPNTRDPGCMSTARNWLNICRRHHSCQSERRFDSFGMNPTRLLQIEQSTTGTLSVRLFYPVDATQKLEYFTLSHMWGNQDFLTLRRDNHDDFLREISLGALSPTFQDAIFVTANLGFKYLWIDSLCILQDESQDWKNESERMAKIYKNAICNLCASMSASERSGLLSDRRRPEPLPPVVHFNGTSRNKSWLLSERMPWGSLRAAPLYRRAWVLQEQILVGSKTYSRRS
jgi:hypothetical protein